MPLLHPHCWDSHLIPVPSSSSSLGFSGSYFPEAGMVTKGAHSTSVVSSISEFHSGSRDDQMALVSGLLAS